MAKKRRKRRFKNKNLNLFTLLLIYIIFGFLFIVVVLGFNTNKAKIDSLFDMNARKVNNDLKEIINEQDKTIEKIKELSKNSNYDFNHPYVYINPFKFNPCSALVIFTTEEPMKVTLEINDNYIGDIEPGTRHIIPIYGLIENVNNHVALTLEDGSKSDLMIQTDTIYSSLKLGKTDRDKNSLLLSYFNLSDASFIYGYDYYNDIRFAINGFNYVSRFNINDNGLTLEYNNKKDLTPVLVDIDYFGRVLNVYKGTQNFIADNNILISFYNDGIKEYKLSRDFTKEDYSNYNQLDLNSIGQKLIDAPLYTENFSASLNNDYLSYDIDCDGYIILVSDTGKAKSYYIDDAKVLKIDSSHEYSLYLNTNDTYYNLYTILKK